MVRRRLRLPQNKNAKIVGAKAIGELERVEWQKMKRFWMLSGLRPMRTLFPVFLD